MLQTRAALPLILLAACASFRCSSTPERHPPSPAPLAVSRDGVLSFLAPPGWTEAAADSTEAGSVIWLIRPEARSSISVREVHLDPVALARVRADSLRSLADLTAALQSKTGSLAPLSTPSVITLGGRQFCVYDLALPFSQDTLRVALFSAGARVYEATAIARGDQAGGTREVFEVLENLLGSLRW